MNSIRPDDEAGDGQRCRICGEVKPWAAFDRDPSMRSRYTNRCKACVSAYNKAYWARRKQAIQAQRAQHAAEPTGVTYRVVVEPGAIILEGHTHADAKALIKLLPTLKATLPDRFPTGNKPRRRRVSSLPKIAEKGAA